MEGKTTIAIDIETWRKLQALKLNPQDSYDAILRRLLSEQRGQAEQEVSRAG